MAQVDALPRLTVARVSLARLVAWSPARTAWAEHGQRLARQS